MTDSLSKLTSMIESARDLTIEAAVSASSRLVDTPSASRPKEISKLLNSRIERDILNGMKCVISLISRGDDGLPYFADVVKNITTSNQKIKNLVMIYLIRYAEVEPDTALLSINSIQKSLNDKNPIHRAKAIRSLSGIRITSIVPILQLCIKRTITDPSPLVRAATAIAIGKVFELETDNKKQLIEYLSKLLADADLQVVSSAIKTYYKVKDQIGSPHKTWEPIHGKFRRLTTVINDFDEWSQSFLIDILTEYSRKFIARPKLYIKNEAKEVIDLPQNPKDIPFPVYDVSFDPDLEMFLNSLRSLVYSRSENVILSIAKALISLAPVLTFREFQVNVALTRVATSSTNSQIVFFALQLISNISADDQSLFGGHYKKFYVFPTDSIPVSKKKLEILSSLVNENNAKYILEELKHYVLTSKSILTVRESIKAIGRCSQLSPEWNIKILKWCLKRIKSTSGVVLNELLTVVRYLIQQKNTFTTNIANERHDIIKTINKLSLILQDHSLALESEAKASIIWMIGEFTDSAENTIGPDVLRVMIKSLPAESEAVRYQVLVLAAKVFSYELNRVKNELPDDQDAIVLVLKDNTIFKMFQHVLHLAKYDQSYDTRDRARLLNVLLDSGSEQAQLASLFLQVPKPVPVLSSEFQKGDNLAKLLSAYMSVSEWADPCDIPSTSIRKETAVQVNSLGTLGVSAVGSSTITKSATPSSHEISSIQYRENIPKATPNLEYKLQSLDEFFGGEDESEESEEVEESEEDSSELEEGDDDEDESEEDEDESQDDGVDYEEAGSSDSDTSTTGFIKN